MREIKFRAWDKRLNRMSYDFVLEFDSEEGTYLDRVLHDKFAYHTENGKNCILMQFTGLKDCNGKEIYEGDIIKVRTWEIVGKNPYAQIIWKEDYKIPIYEDTADYYILTSTYVVKGKNVVITLAEAISELTIDVVGNVFENPELLQKEG